MQHCGRYRLGGGDHGARIRIEQVGLRCRRCTPGTLIRAGFGVIQNELELAIETHERHPNH
jgi:hypothetical protein